MGNTALIERKFDFGTDPDTMLPEVAIFDSVLSEEHSFDIAITEEPVETGVSMADHAYAKPRRLAMEVTVSDTPLIYDGEGTPSYRLADSWTGAGAGDVRRSVNALEYLDSKAHEFAVFDVQTGLKLYQNMMLESGQAATRQDTAGKLKATLKLHQVTFATTGSVTYPRRGPKKSKRAGSPKTDAGKKQASEPSVAVQKPVSAAYSLLIGQ